MFFASKCSPLYLFNEWGDPHIYFSIGKGIVNGKVLYKDLFDHKGPLIFFIYGLGYLTSSSSFTGIYILESLFLFASLLFVYKSAKLFVAKEYAFLSALLFTIIFIWRNEKGGSADEFAVPFLVVSLYYTLRYSLNTAMDIKLLKRYYLIHGLMFAAVFLIKFSICVFWPFLLLIPVVDIIREKRYKDIFAISLSFASGFALVLLPVLLYFAVNGATGDFIFAYFTINSLYASSTGDTITAIAEAIAGKIRGIDLYTYLLLAGVAIAVLSKRFFGCTLHRICFVAAFCVTFAAASRPFDMSYPYVVLSVFAIPALIWCMAILAVRVKMKIDIAVKVAFALGVLTISIYSKKLFDYDIPSLLRTEEHSYMQKEFASIVNMKENPTLLELEHDTGVFTEANLVPAYKYFFHPNIKNALFPDIRLSHIELVKEKEPTFVITRNLDFPFLLDNYHIVARHSLYSWDEEYVYLLERNN
ncbi:glycosyltransferase family 39 protein [Dysgonomonas sp. 511]|uniref:ArnT family glycosyltransferase n=1 Tax=Dysgonomonas sp. 511 TaxID=2302930 RepID=UPI0013D2AF5F|nr:glycosyltransferase family 39 protein [Dysgonomonas sp. 511]